MTSSPHMLLVPETTLQGRGLCLQYQTSRRAALRAAVDDVDITLRAGERVALIGRSGSGKTTLVKMLLCLLAPTRGTVRFAGQVMTPGPVRRLRPFRRKVQYIPQDPAASLDPSRTVQHLVRDPLIRLQVPGDHDAITHAALDRVHLGESFLHRRRAQLSGGQAQRVAIARALAVGSELLVADEPVSGLDLPLRDEVLELLHELSVEQSLGVLFVTHDLDAARKLCTRGLVMAQGRVVEDGGMHQLLSDPRQDETRLLMRSAPRIPERLLAGAAE